MENSVIIANGIGLLLYPLTYWQYHKAQNQRWFLVANFFVCVVSAVSFWLTSQNTAAMVALAAGSTSLFQIHRTHPAQKLGLAALSIGTVAWIVPPDGLFPWMALMSYGWNRTAECFDEMTMRILFLISPVLWAMISWHGRNHSLVSVDVLAFFLSLHWIIRRWLHLAKPASPYQKGTE
jgi:hypothetical protein